MFLGFNVHVGLGLRTVARGTLESAGHRNTIKKKAYRAYTKINALLCLTLQNNSKSN